MKMKGKTFRLPDELIAAIAERAAREDRTESQVVRRVLEKAIRVRIRKQRRVA